MRTPFKRTEEGYEPDGPDPGHAHEPTDFIPTGNHATTRMEILGFIAAEYERIVAEAESAKAASEQSRISRDEALAKASHRNPVEPEPVEQERISKIWNQKEN